MRRGAALLVALVAVAAVVAGPGTAPVRAQDTGWRITAFDAHLVVDGAGDVVVTERLAVDFGGLERRGIFRVLPVRYPVPAEVTVPDGDPTDWYRVLDVRGVRVTSPTAPDDVDLTRPGTSGTELTIRIGDPDRTITGAHEYVISYRVRGALQGTNGVPELYWNATGDAWPVPIDRASVRVEGAPVTEVACFAGVGGSSSPCAEATASASRASFAADGLLPGEGVTVAVGFEPGSVTVAPPLLERRWTLRDAFVGSPWAWPLAAVVAVVALGGLAALLYREGRDRVRRGGVTVSGHVDPERPAERRRRLLEPRPVPVEFRPTDGLRPGQIGLLVDERVDPVDLSATIVDLAVRGHLTIEEEQEKVLWRTRTDWVLRRTPAREEGGEDDGLLRYERRLLDGLFATGDEVRVSELTGTFASEYQLAEDDLYADAGSRGWFARRPDEARAWWLGVSLVALAAAAGVTYLAARYTRVAVAAVPLVLAALLLLALHGRMPRRTGRGSDLLVRSLGFREFIATADAERLRFAEAEGTFLPYLPYAVVFGETERWARAFADLGTDLGTSVGGWYVGHGAFDAARFSSGLSDFSTAASTALSTVPSSGGGTSGFGGGGFSGGGMGGGGGGSW